MEILSSLILSFIAGGVLCVIAQLLIDLTKLTPARILVLFVTVGTLLYAIGVYDPIFKIFGEGVSLPLIGFGANIGRGVKEAVDKTGILGALSGGLEATAAGIALTIFLGLLISLFVKGKSKKMSKKKFD